MAFDCTWSIETSISFIDELVSSAVSESASTFLATSLIEYAISSIEETVSRTLPASSPTFSATSSLVAVISRIDELDSSALEASVSTCVDTSLIDDARSRASFDVSSTLPRWPLTPSLRRRTESSMSVRVLPSIPPSPWPTQ